MGEFWMNAVMVILVGFVTLIVLIGVIKQIFDELRKKSERETEQITKILNQLPQALTEITNTFLAQQKAEEEKKELEYLRTIKKEFEK